MLMLLYCTFMILLLKNVLATEKYSIVVDAGSTGSRGFIVKFGNDGSIQSIKGKKVKPGLSSFASQPEHAAEYLLPIFIEAATIIPIELHTKTSVYIKGTAGMRLLTAKEQNDLWASIFLNLLESESFPFTISVDSIGTIDGAAEAYYAVIASNYIAGTLDSSLVPVDDSQLIGALDMGGSSTQMIFYSGSKNNRAPVQQSDFWLHSWLNFGVERVRQKVWDHIIAENLPLNASADLIEISNPCTFLGHEYSDNSGTVLVGSGRGEECVEIIKKVVWPKDELKNCEPGMPCPIDGVEHPSLAGQFYGMSVYYYAIDCIRQLGSHALPSWPNPSIDDIEAAAVSFCAHDWAYVQANMYDTHPYTDNAQLAHRCVEGLYIATLLEHGFGFHGTSRNITIALDVNGFEVEWALGYALAELNTLPIKDVATSADADSIIINAKTAIMKLFQLPSTVLYWLNKFFRMLLN